MKIMYIVKYNQILIIKSQKVIEIMPIQKYYLELIIQILKIKLIMILMIVVNLLK